MTNVTNTEDSLNTVTTESGSNLTSWLVPTQQQTTGEIWRIPQSPPCPPCEGRDLLFVFAVRTFNPNLSGSICLSYVLSICQKTMVYCWQELKHSSIVIPMIYWTLEVLLSVPAWPSPRLVWALQWQVKTDNTLSPVICWLLELFNCLEKDSYDQAGIYNMLLTLYTAVKWCDMSCWTGCYFLHQHSKARDLNFLQSEAGRSWQIAASQPGLRILNTITGK